ncbi:MAG: hypothetical protein WAQ32_08955 [Dethiobacteria bacterium]|nr:hypothetical protein [Bacillota bacterium]
MAKARTGRKCSICNHEKVDEINRLLLNGTSYRNISEKFSVSAAALSRHKNQHIARALAKARGAKATVQGDSLLAHTQELQARETAQADGLLAQVIELRDKALSILTKAEQAGELRTALTGIREARACLELLAKLQGELQQEGTVNVVLAPQWLELRTVILQTLEPWPEARLALAQAVKEAEADAGR